MKLQEIISRVYSFSIYDKEKVYVTEESELFLNNKEVALGIDLDNYDLYNDVIICIKNDDTIVGDLVISNKQYLKSSIN